MQMTTKVTQVEKVRAAVEKLGIGMVTVTVGMGIEMGAKETKTLNLRRQMILKTAVEMVIGLVTVSMGTEMVIVRTDSMDIEMGEKEKKTSNLSRQMVTPKTAVEMLVIGMVTVSMGMEMVIVRTDCTDIEMVIVRTDCTDIG